MVTDADSCQYGCREAWELSGVSDALVLSLGSSYGTKADCSQFITCISVLHISLDVTQPEKPVSEKPYFLRTSFNGVFVNLWNSRSDFISFQTFMMVFSSVRSFSCSASRSFRVCLRDVIIDELVSAVFIYKTLIVLRYCILKETTLPCTRGCKTAAPGPMVRASTALPRFLSEFGILCISHSLIWQFSLAKSFQYF